MIPTVQADGDKQVKGHVQDGVRARGSSSNAVSFGLCSGSATP